jgi:Bacterial conjugation TrbI-like protein
MNDTPPIETNLEALKQLTGAPDLEEPLLQDDAFSNTEVHSSRPTWKMPIPKLMLIGGALVPVFAFAGYFIMSSQQLQRSEPSGVSSQADANIPQPDETAEELRQAREEIAALKSRMALNDQAYIQTQRPAQSQRERSTVVVPEQTSQARTPEASTPTRSRSVAVQSVPPPTVASYRPPTPQTQMAPTSVRAVTPVSRAEQLTQADPVEQWQQLAQVGSYGAIAPPENLPVTASSNSRSQTDLTSENSSLVASTTDIPTAYIAPTSAVSSASGIAPVDREATSVPNSPSLETIPDVQTADVQGIEPPTNVDDGRLYPEAIASETTNPEITASNSEAIAHPDMRLPSENSDYQEATNTPEVTSYPPVLAEAEAAILEGQPRMQAIIAGASTTGRLETPVILDTPTSPDHFLVVLAEPLKDNHGRVAIPDDGTLLVQVDNVSESGQVELSATQAVWQTQRGQRELVLPERAILIRGEDGDPLIAEHYDDRGPEIAGMDAGQFALGAIRRTAELFTRADTRVQTGDGTTVITENNPEPNILAGALEGGTDAILDTITERNQRAVEALEQRPNIGYIEAGTPVQVFVNQSMQMPM